MPGNHCPLLADSSLATYAAAYSEVVEQLDRPCYALGSSLGGTVALGLHAPNLRGVVALDPPLRSASCTPLIAPFRARLAQHPGNEALRDFISSAFGITADGLEERDHLDLLGVGDAPAVVIGADGPGDRSCASLLGPPEREILRGLPRVRLVTTSAAGHNVVAEDPRTVLRELLALLRTTSGQNPETQPKTAVSPPSTTS
jgi:pimeloyl-ACP methyl ester carboxylesterase